MKKIIVLFFVLLPAFCTAQKGDNNIVIGKAETIYSKVLNEERGYWVYVPESYNDTFSAKQKYPVIYLLDGPSHFNDVEAMVQKFGSLNIFPEMIIVAILNTDRTRDLTTSHVVSGYPFLDSNSVKTSGGAENFTMFLEKELIPHIDSLYSTASYRLLIGHSFGGLFVINTLINHTDLFNSYVSIDPSLWWDDQKLLKSAINYLHTQKFLGKSLFVSSANTMNPGMDTMRVRKDNTPRNVAIRSTLQFTDNLKKYPGNGLRWNYKHYQKENHNSVPFISEYDALHFIFDYYQFPAADDLYDTTVNVQLVVDHIMSHYKDVSEKLRYKVLPPEYFVVNLAWYFLGIKKYDRAYAFFKINTENYPDSFHAMAAMGDYYVEMGDKKNAIEYFNKALKIKDWPGTREQVEKLKAEE